MPGPGKGVSTVYCVELNSSKGDATVTDWTSAATKIQDAVDILRPATKSL